MFSRMLRCENFCSHLQFQNLIRPTPAVEFKTHPSPFQYGTIDLIHAVNARFHVRDLGSELTLKKPTVDNV